MDTESAITLENKYGSFNYAPLPVVLSKGRGVYLWDLEGKRYLDFMSGFSAVSQGHCHPRIVRAIQKQAAQLAMVSRGLYSDQMGPFAKFATELFGFERILMMNTGAEAFETAVKMARKWGYEKKNVYPGSAQIVTCIDNFHGRTTGAVAASSHEGHHRDFGPLQSGFNLIPFDDLIALESALSNPSVVAFIVEPIQGEAGVNVPSEGYLRKAFELCRSKKVLFIADEIQTGIGRTGKLLACFHENFRPDVVLLGKALSGGTFPISAVLADENVISVLQPGDHGSTFGGSPFACHVAHESLKVILEENLTENAEKMGNLFRETIQSFHLPLVKLVRGRGLLNAISFDFGGDLGAGNRMCIALKEVGLLAKTCRPHIIRFAPPLVINQEQMQEGLEVIKRVIHTFRSDSNVFGPL